MLPHPSFRESKTQAGAVNLGMTASELLTSTKRFLSSCAPLDNLLGGGLSSGQMLEISGPPGSPRERIMLRFISQTVKDGEELLYLSEWDPSIIYLHE